MDPSKTFQHPFEKRIKRHVIGRKQTFFAATIPGFEPLVDMELSFLGDPSHERNVLPGGVEFKARLEGCYLANLKLRTAQRILMRIGRFKAMHFSSLRKKTAEIPWELLLNPAQRLEIHVTTKHSRLYHSGAVEGCVLAAIKGRLATQGISSTEAAPDSRTAGIFVRAQDDVFTLSLDSSGTLLHQRGIKPHKAKAPLRETIAAAALLHAGYDGTVPFLDPMCGSGTFALEAALLARNIPPGWYREFAFMSWPAFDKRSCTLLEESLRVSRLEGTVKVLRADFFDLNPGTISGGSPGFLAINPPYGLRMGKRKESDTLFLEVCKKLQKDFRHWKLALIVPRRHLLYKVPFPLRVHPILHGGLRLSLLTGVIP
ncbi:MAG: hypothetical protein JRF57_12130 [Deltaproteobacteria bacterium]|nr:hypothetical protein [Deltaproteobacteria bacterium]